MALLFGAYVIGYPLLQIWTLLRCRGSWRAAALAGLVIWGPFYLWALYKVFTPQPNGDLSGLLILLGVPLTLLHLGVVAVQSRGKPRPPEA
jgi:hypothetical protein